VAGNGDKFIALPANLLLACSLTFASLHSQPSSSACHIIVTSMGENWEELLFVINENSDKLVSWFLHTPPIKNRPFHNWLICFCYCSKRCGWSFYTSLSDCPEISGSRFTPMGLIWWWLYLLWLKITHCIPFQSLGKPIKAVLVDFL